MRNPFVPQSIDPSRQQVFDANALARAQIDIGKNQKPFNVQRFDFDLSTARSRANSFVIKSAFRSLWIGAATDSSTEISILPYTLDDFQSPVPLKKNDALTFPAPISEAYVYWSAQSGKTISLFVFTEGEFRTGTLTTVQSGTVAIGWGDTLTQSQVTLSAGSAGILFAANSSRKYAEAYNDTGASIFLGGSTVTDSGTTKGIEYPNGSKIPYASAAAAYAYSASGGTLNLINYT